MHIIIAGGSGFIGSHLTRSLLKHKHTLTIISRFPQKNQMSEKVNFLGWDAKNLTHIIENADTVINLCGSPIFSKAWTSSRKELLIKSRIQPSKTLINILKSPKSKVTLYIQASASGYYTSDTDMFQTEGLPSGHDFLSLLCKQWEDCLTPLTNKNIRTLIIRTGLPFDKHQGIFPHLIRPFHFFVGGCLGTGRQWLPWIHIDDYIHGILHLIQNTELSGPYNLCAPKGISNKELADKLGKKLHRPSFMNIPKAFLTLFLGQRSSLLLSGQKMSCEKLLNSGFEFKYSTIDLALDDLLMKKRL